MAAAELAADPKAAIPVDLRRERRLVCVEYPGVVRNEAKMLQTLGGEESVSRVRSWETLGRWGRNPVYRMGGTTRRECGFLGNEEFRQALGPVVNKALFFCSRA